MATTVSESVSYNVGGLTWLFLKLTAGAADTTVTYTIQGFPELKAMTMPVKTTGTTGSCNAVYNKATGVITISSLANNDVVRFGVCY